MQSGQPTGRGTALPTLGVAFSTLLWGTSWYPLRIMHARGLDDAWAITLLFGIVLLAMLPFAWPRRSLLLAHWRVLVLSGLAGGLAMTAYYLSVTATEVIRAVLLFYMAPVWGTLIEAVVLRQRVAPTRIVSLLLGAAGLLVVLGGNASFPVPQNRGDWLALAAGLSFSVSTTLVFRESRLDSFGATFGCVAGTVVMAGLAIVAAGVGWLDAQPITGLALQANGGLLVGMALFCVFPMCFLTLWGARLISPARLSLLLMGEVCVAVLSAALLTHEPIGLREISGTLLVLSAALAESLPVGGLRKSVAHHRAD